jgi:hypothetical protein
MFIENLESGKRSTSTLARILYSLSLFVLRDSAFDLKIAPTTGVLPFLFQ